MTSTPAPALMTAEELAERTGFSRQRIWYAARTGLLPSIRCGHRVFFNRELVEAWLRGAAPAENGKAS